MPHQKRGRSKQDYQTPPEFLGAVKRYLGIEDFTIDLAASISNRVTEEFWSKEDNALKQSWKLGPGWAWCNPPFSHLDPWVRRGLEQAHDTGAQTAMLVPAGVGSNWFKKYVHRKAYVLFLNGRITFVGQPTCYPKDCLLLLFSSEVPPGYDVWTWPEE